MLLLEASIRSIRILVNVGFWTCLLISAPPVAQATRDKLSSSEIPPQAAAVGYTVHTFSSNFRASEVDLAGTFKSAFKWYPWKFFGKMTNLTSISANSDGSITLLGDATGPNGQLATASPASGTPGFVGMAFGAGGYFEAVLKFNPQDIIKNDFRGWPSWWSMAIEHMANLDTAQWPGQPKGYEHFIEVDFFEYDLSGYVKSGKLNYFGGTMHDWFGLYGKGYNRLSLPYSTIVRKVPVNTDFTQYHRYGFLWVPATAIANGFAEYYFDGQKVGEATLWSESTGQEPPPIAPWTFSILDKNHLVLILGTGIGEPMTIISVNVWQASAAGNLVQ